MSAPLIAAGRRYNPTMRMERVFGFLIGVFFTALAFVFTFGGEAKAANYSIFQMDLDNSIFDFGMGMDEAEAVKNPINVRRWQPISIDNGKRLNKLAVSIPPIPRFVKWLQKLMRDFAKSDTPSNAPAPKGNSLSKTDEADSFVDDSRVVVDKAIGEAKDYCEEHFGSRSLETCAHRLFLYTGDCNDAENKEHCLFNKLVKIFEERKRIQTRKQTSSQHGFKRTSQTRESLPDVGRFDIERRCETHRVFAGCDDD